MAQQAQEEVAGRLRQFLSRYCRNQDLRDEDDIFALGFVNSLVAMQLVLFVEKEFSVRVENDDLDLANFRSISAISSLVARNRGADG